MQIDFRRNVYRKSRDEIVHVPKKQKLIKNLGKFVFYAIRNI